MAVFVFTGKYAHDFGTHEPSRRGAQCDDPGGVVAPPGRCGWVQSMNARFAIWRVVFSVFIMT